MRQLRPLFLPLDPQILHQRADAISDKDPETAARLYEYAVDRDPTQHESWVNLGFCYFQLKEMDNAEECWLKAISVVPDLPEALYNLGHLYQDRGQWEAAAAFYRQSIQSDPEFEDAYFNLGIVLEKLGRLHESLVARRLYLQHRTGQTWNIEARAVQKAIRRLENYFMNGVDGVEL